MGIKWIDDSKRIPVYSWCAFLEDRAKKQAGNLASLPFAFHHIGLMPDAHSGYGMPIGGVLATEEMIVPNAVGVDIGCGMGFIETNIPVTLLREVMTGNGNLIHTIIATIKRNIPVGFEHHKGPQISVLLDHPSDTIMNLPVVHNEIESAKYQLGTLGGGNHFLELQVNEKGNLCLMLHSGSRNFGYKIAKHYNNTAIELGYQIDPDPEFDLAYLPIESQDGEDYINAMNFALEFAKENRALMMERMKNTVFNLIKKHTGFSDIQISEEINAHHNYADIEEHFGKTVWVHRKGAIKVEAGELGIIPGSMGTASYIVKGLGNPESFNSASHGSGRIMGRNDFNKKHTLEEVNKAMSGIEFLGWGKGRKGELDISEAPQAYKPIDEVIEAENDLVEVVMKLKPIGVVKG
jgi:tRNA-splicing ligase RtcB (3'-phosphate/5'-hydroxy nucleic acid ligase)